MMDFDTDQEQLRNFDKLIAAQRWRNEWLVGYLRNGGFWFDRELNRMITAQDLEPSK